MRKCKLVKIFLIIAFGFFAFFLNNRVFGYQLEYKGVYDDKNNGLFFISMGNAYGMPPGWIKFEDNNNNYISLTKQGVYQSYKFMIQSDINTIYGTKGYKFNYVKTKKVLEVKNVEKFSRLFSSFEQNNVGYANGKKNIEKGNIYRGVSNFGRNVVSVYDAGVMNVKNPFYDKKNSEIYKSNSKFNEVETAVIEDLSYGQRILVTKWKVSAEKVREILTKNQSLYIKEDNAGKYFWYSTPCILNNQNTYNPDYNYVALETAYDAICGFNKNNNDAGKVGYDFGGYNKDLHITSPSGFQSIINLYDNKLYIPAEMVNPQEIYIRHVECDKDGKVKRNSDGTAVLIDQIINSKEIKQYKENNSWKDQEIANMITKIPKSVKNSPKKYQEYFSIPLSEQLKVYRSMTIVDNGTQYKYKGVRIGTDKTLDGAENKLNISTKTSMDDAVVVKETKNNKQVTVIEFKYCKENNTTPPPDGGFKTINSDDENEDCSMVKTPTDTDLIPYLVANKFKINTLKYKYEKNGDIISYKIDTFNINKLESGTVANNITKEPEKGTIFGDGIWTLFDGDSAEGYGKEFSVNVNGIDKSINDFYKKYMSKMPKANELDDFTKLNKTKKSDFTKDNTEKFHIPTEKANGIRIPKIKANYKQYNITENAITKINDKLYVDENDNIRCYVLVFNPIEVSAPKIQSEGVVDHSANKNSSSQNVIQKNANFKLEIDQKKENIYGQTGNEYAKYIDRYFLIFDFDIIKIEDSAYKTCNINGNSLDYFDVSVGSVIPRGSLIEVEVDHTKGKTEFKAKAGGNDNDKDIITQDENTVVLIGVSNNMPSEVLISEVLKNQAISILDPASITDVQIYRYISKNNNSEYYLNGEINKPKQVLINYCDYNLEDLPEMISIHDSKYHKDHKMYNDAYYFARAVTKTKNVGRIYDFKVTDCTDIDYKSVFRKSENGNVNDLTNIQYFSGIKELKLFSGGVNTLENRENINIGSNGAAKTIIPLGPYKHTNISYANAPKMGYRICFDLKTSGYFNYQQGSSDRKIVIKPSYYYISKDGEKFKENITLYYKDSAGKYKKFVGSGYIIYFKPNDGYRNTLNGSVTNNTSYMSTQLEKLVIGDTNGFELNNKMMSTSASSFIQSWYGEFKLPNSTIAVEGSNSNISHPLEDGYVGVKFNIICIDGKDSTERTISYNENNKNANPNENTTQWDYEGFIGFQNPGKKVDSNSNLNIQLERGLWKIDNQDLYNSIKGTVVLFDIDNRAANDFD